MVYLDDSGEAVACGSLHGTVIKQIAVAPDRARKLQSAVLEAEKRMFAATGGVNTHKGAVYSMGLLCAGSAMLLSGEESSPCEAAAKLASQLPARADQTHGAAVREKFSSGGAREEAFEGFPHAASAAAMLDAGAPATEVLLRLMSEVEDSNLLWRGGREGLDYVRNTAAELLALPARDREAQLRGFDAACIDRGLSPGGSADLLAAALFLHSLSPTDEIGTENAKREYIRGCGASAPQPHFFFLIGVERYPGRLPVSFLSLPLFYGRFHGLL